MNEFVIYDTIDISDVRYEIENINYFNNKIIPYNAKSKIPMHKFWIYIDKCKMIKNYTKNENSYFLIALAPSSDTIKNIKSTEKIINNKLIEDEITRFILISKLIDTGSNIPTLELLVDNSTNLFDKNDKKIEMKNLENNTELSLLIELDYFLLSNNYLKTYWKAVQMKIIQTINLLDSLFPTTNEKLKIPILPSLSTQPIEQIQPIKSTQSIEQFQQNQSIESNQNNHHQMLTKLLQSQQLQRSQQSIESVENKSNQQTQRHKTVEKPVQPAVKKQIFVIPTAQDLANAISGLKKINNPKTNKTEQNETPKFNKFESIQTELKHVETKESNIYQMLKEEHLNKITKENEKTIPINNLKFEQLEKINRLEQLRRKSRKYHKKILYLLD